MLKVTLQVLLAGAGLLVGAQSARASTFSVNDYGAMADGTTLNTTAIQKTIDAAAGRPGSVVTLQPGTYLTGSIFVKSGVTLRIDKGVHISNIKAMGAKTAFEVDAFPEMPVDHFTFDHLQIVAQKAGHIFDARDWTFKDTTLTIADGGAVESSDDQNVTGIPTKPAGPQIKADPAKQSFAEQDKH